MKSVFSNPFVGCNCLLRVCDGVYVAAKWLLKLAAMLFTPQKQEYRVDEFAVKAGFGARLLLFLEKVKNFDWSSKQSLLLMLRIGEIEKILCSN